MRQYSCRSADATPTQTFLLFFGTISCRSRCVFGRDIPDGTRVRFVALDSWRGICALLVVLFHVSSVISSSLEASTFIGNAYLFVDFFFVLSGFVLCHRYRDKISDRSDFWQFVIRRFARVWPVHAFVLGIFLFAIVIVNHMPHPQDLALTWDNNSYSVEAILPSVLLLNAFGLQGSVWNGPAWSIGAEFYVYSLFALVLIGIYRRFSSYVSCSQALRLR